MWKHLSEKDKRKICVKQLKSITLQKIIIKQLLYSFFYFLFVLFVGVMLLFPGRYSRDSTIPTLEEIVIRSIFCLGIIIILSIIILLFSLISYYCVPQDIKINNLYHCCPR